MSRAGPSKLIVCELPKGKSRAVLDALKRDKGIVTANVNYARGTLRRARRMFRRTSYYEEREILQVVVPAERQDELFEFIHEQAEIGRPRGGSILQMDLAVASLFRLPDLPEEG